MISARSGDVGSPQETWFWIGCFALAAAAAAIAVVGTRLRREDRSHAMFASTICLVASSAYFAMASGQLDLQVGDVTVQLPRYLDWSITTPLLLLSVVTVALTGVRSWPELRQRSTLLVALVGMDLLMIVTGAIAALNATSWIRWIWFVVSSGFFVGVLLVLGAIYADARKRSGAEAPNVKLASRLVGYLVVLWVLYPVEWALGPEGAKLWGTGTDGAVYTVLDLLAKPVFGLLLVLGVLRMSRQVRAREGVETIALVSEQLGSGTDRARAEGAASATGAARS